MFSRLISAEQASQLLDLESSARLDEALANAGVKATKTRSKRGRYRVGDIVLYRLAEVIHHVGVDVEKAWKYAETILESRLEAHDRHLLEWVENETQDLFCLIADNQLARIFLRNKEDDREVDVGAVKPVLFPQTKCEINVFRVIRPVIIRAQQLPPTK